MYKEDIIEETYRSHKKFVNYMRSLSLEDYSYNHENTKWAPYQDLDHHKKVIKKLALVLSIPKFILKLVYGYSNNPSRSYDNLFKIYQIRINDGVKSANEFTPLVVKQVNIEKDCDDFLSVVENLLVKVGKLTEYDLDSVILPQPILGKITLREMLYFCKFHVEMHQAICQRNLRLKQMIIN